MTTLSFYSAKGGTGKTTFNMTFASYLKYHLGKEVVLLDTDGPEYSLFNSREREKAFAKENGGIDESALYPVWKVPDISPKGIDRLAGKLSILDGKINFIVIDFAGSCKKEDAVWAFAKKKLLNLVVIPVDMDPMALASAMQMAEVFRATGQEVMLFFNRVHGKIPRTKYDAVEAVFRARGFRFSEHRVKNALAMGRDTESRMDFLRSTVCFPVKTVRELNPSMIDLFNEVIGYEETREKAGGKDDT